MKLGHFDDEAVLSEILKRFENHPSISFSKVAIEAYKRGKVKLAANVVNSKIAA